MSNVVKLFLLSYNIPHIYASSVAPGQMLQIAASDQGLHCLKTSGGSRGGSGGLLEPPFDTKSFHLHREFSEKITNQNPFVLNPLSRNPGSAPANIPVILIGL